MTSNIDRLPSKNTDAQRVGDLEPLIGRHRNKISDFSHFRVFEAFKNTYALNLRHKISFI